MDLEENAEEILETLWIKKREEGNDNVSLKEAGATKKPLDQLLKAGYVTVEEDKISLTEKGMPEARSVVRRHRLAERLLYDVLGTGGGLMHDKACKFEHLLDKGLDENICKLLGHPKICPHGKPIPPGRCCQMAGKTPISKLVSPLSQLTKGQRGTVAYIYAPESSRLQKLMAMGILPGAPVKLIQDFPSYVFEAGQTQFAVDKEIAEAIYVRLMSEDRGEPEETPPPGTGRGGRRFGFFGRRRRCQD